MFLFSKKIDLADCLRFGILFVSDMHVFNLQRDLSIIFGISGSFVSGIMGFTMVSLWYI